VTAALAEHAELVAREVLAVDYGPGAGEHEAGAHEDPELGLTFWLRRA
jgi:hypothetical protein